MSLQPLNRSTANAPLNFPVKVLQFGEGNFLRAFVDWMIDILNEKTDFGAAVQIVQPLQNGMGDVLNSQDGLYHLKLNGLSGGKNINETKMISCVKGVINPYSQWDEYLAQAENPDLRFVVSNTTEAGIAFNENDTDPKAVSHSFPGKLTSLLFHRFTHFSGSPDKGFIFLPCELIDKNGHNLKKTVLQYVDLWNLPADFKAWVENNNVFCNTLVDRIVPGYPKDTIEEIKATIGYDDQMVVTGEPFHFWAIETDQPVAAELPLDKAGLDVKFVADLTPYRTRKVRILNGAHTAMVPYCYLNGLRTVREALEDENAGNFVKEIVYKEIVPIVDLPENELLQFADSVVERFLNPYVRHELISISLNSVSKFKVRVLPSILDYHQKFGKLPVNMVRAFAWLMMFYKGEFKGETIPLNDDAEVISFMKNAWNSGSVEATVEQILANTDFWNTNLTEVNNLKELIVEEIKANI